jgi:hypothetical protein
MIRFTLLLILFAMSGCAQTVWSKNGATESDLARDRTQCQIDIEAANPSFTNPNRPMKQAVADSNRFEDLLNNCLTSKGWAASKAN